MIQLLGASGWFHESGFHLPYDSKLFDTSLPIEYHTRFVEDWAEIAYEAINQKGFQYAEQIAYFMDTATTNTPSISGILGLGLK